MSTWQIILDHPIVQALGWTLLHSLWQCLAVAIVLAVLLRAMRRSTADARYALAIGALAVVFISMCATFAGLVNHHVIDHNRTEVITHSPLAATDQPIIADQTSDQIESPSASLPWTFSAQLRAALPWCVVLWAGGVMVLSIYRAGGWMLVQQLRRSGSAVDSVGTQMIFDDLVERFGISRGVCLVQSALVQVPTAMGWLSPIVLLPAGALTGFSPEQLRGLLAHELAHVRRCDYLANLVQTAIETLLFYHPAIWWMGKTIRQERENCCDDLAAAVCDRRVYAQALTALEQLRHTPTLALSAGGGQLLMRIRRILGLPADRQRSITTSLAASVSAVAILLVLLNACTAQQSAHRSEAIPQSEASVQSPNPPEISEQNSIQERVATTQDFARKSALTKPTQRLSAGSPKQITDYQIQVVDEQSRVLDAQLAEAKSKFGTNHPVVKNLETRAASAKANLIKQARQYTDLGKYDQALGVVDQILIIDPQNQYATNARPSLNEKVAHTTSPFSPAETGPAVVYVSGVARSGVYKMSDTGMTLKQALVAAGQGEAVDNKNVILIQHPQSTPFRPAARRRVITLQDALQGDDANVQLGRDDVVMVTDAQTAIAEKYSIFGDVPRSGEFSLEGQRINLLQALITAGANPPEISDKQLQVTRQAEDGEHLSWFMVSQLVKEGGGQFTLRAGDRVEVKNAGSFPNFRSKTGAVAVPASPAISSQAPAISLEPATATAP